MDKVLESAYQLSEELKKEPVIIEFLRVKEIYESDEELAEMRKEIAYLSTLEDISEYDKKKQMYDNHPLVSNYNYLKNEVVDLLTQIKEIIL